VGRVSRLVPGARYCKFGSKCGTVPGTTPALAMPGVYGDFPLHLGARRARRLRLNWSCRLPLMGRLTSAAFAISPIISSPGASRQPNRGPTPGATRLVSMALAARSRGLGRRRLALSAGRSGHRALLARCEWHASGTSARTSSAPRAGFLRGPVLGAETPGPAATGATAEPHLRWWTGRPHRARWISPQPWAARQRSTDVVCSPTSASRRQH